MTTRGQIYVFSGPSGVGKSTVIRKLRERIEGIGYSVSHTTRLPRSNEVSGVDYHFIDRDTFCRMVEKDGFVEWAAVYSDLYGTSFSSLRDQIDKGLDVMLDLDSQGAKNIRKTFKESTLIYILPPTLEILEKRLRARAADTDDVLVRRMKEAGREVRDCQWYDYLIINDDLERALREAESIIISERCRNLRAFPRVKEMFNL